ncbi:MAG: hypothetical protein DHS20C01_08690 [marine bacterium B5-7]|nr:MAG: hypothetical protein DHS20C01_08690 [marine bacterium B5-7]
MILLRQVSILALLVVALDVSAADDVVVRMGAEPESEVLIGQQVSLHVDVLGLNGWASIPIIPEINLSGAYVLPVSTQSSRLTETIEGESYSGQRYNWLIYPQRTGKLEIPALSIDVELKVFGADSKTQQVNVSTSPVTIDVVTPPGAENVSNLIVSNEFTVSDQLIPVADQLTKPLNTGDAIKRTITRKATGVSGMAFAPLEFDHIPGISIYTGEPQVKDIINRGTLERGVRVETLTFVAEEVGSHVLPGFEFNWWDLKSKSLKKEVLDPIKIKVISPPASQSQTGGPRHIINLIRTVISWLVVVTILTIILWLLIGSRVQRSLLSLKRWRGARREREVVYFKKFVAVAKTGDRSRTRTALMAWLDRLLPASTPQLDQFLDHYIGLQHRDERRLILRNLNISDGEFESGNLIEIVSDARRCYLKCTKGVGQPTGFTLQNKRVNHLAALNPPVNPT